jgi:hypothetical protein
MSRKLTAAYLFAVASLAGCAGAPLEQRIRAVGLSPYQEARRVVFAPDPVLFVQWGGAPGTSTFTPQGWYWVPQSNIDIQLYGEPSRDTQTGELSSGPWRALGTVRTDSVGMFGFNTGALNTTVRRVCGSPPDWLMKPFFMAIDKSNGLVSFRSMEPGDWFTHTPCS